MNAFLPSSVPAAELQLVRTDGRSAARYAIYPPPGAFHVRRRALAYDVLPAPDHFDAAGRSLAIHLHLPFCYSACAFCHCTKIATRDGGKATRYLDFLERDIAGRAAAAGEGRSVARMHWGGGTPTYYTTVQLQRVWRALRRHFEFPAEGDYSIEIDPRTVGEAAIGALRQMGFTVAALCIPDLAPDVLEAIARPQPADRSLEAIAAARRAGFRTVAVEVMYGLPRQNAASLAATLSALLAARPDRVALHDYVHAPRRHKAQRQLSFHELPRASERLEMLAVATECLAARGYAHVAAETWALPGDALAAARGENRLAFDALGCTAAGETDLLPLGASALGATRDAYSQNESDLGAYYDRLGSGLTPVARGIVLTPDDMLRRAVIRMLLCQGKVDYPDLETGCSIRFERYFAAELAELQRYAAAGLLRIEGRQLVLESRGWLWVRNLCAVFDRYRTLRSGTARHTRRSL